MTSLIFWQCQAKRETEILKRRNIAVEDDTVSLVNNGQVAIYTVNASVHLLCPDIAG